MRKKLLNGFPAFFKDLAVKYKFLLSYFVLIIIPLGLLTALSYNKTYNVIETQVTNSAIQVLEQTSSFLSYKMQNIIEVSDTIFSNQEIQDILTRDINSYDEIQQIEDCKKAGKFIIGLQDSRDIYRIRLYIRDGLIYSNENINFFNLKDIVNTEWYKKIADNNGKVCWSPSYEFTYLNQNSRNIISASRLIRNNKNISETIGVVSIDILTDSIREIIRKVNLTKRGSVYIVNEEGEVVTYSNEESNENVFNDKSYVESVLGNTSARGIVNINGQKAIVAEKGVDNTGWKLIAIIPLDGVLLQPAFILRNYVLMLMLVIGTIAYVFAYYMSDYIVKRITLLIKTMQKVQTGNLDVKVAIDGKDEIGKLQENFNFMIEKMRILVTENYKIGKEVKNAELKALQAQINPHFLYNTLDLINWMAIRQKAKGISFMVNALAKFYKLSLSKGKDIVSISDEIMHVKIYVQIQNKRFDERIKLDINIEEEVYDYSILKIILQPLVENSILHGILEKEDKTGTIEISGRLEDSRIILGIRDDGKGMSEEKLLKLLDEEETAEDQGYGVRNINRRIKLHYGENYGLIYKSAPGSGTLVEVRIPALKL